MIPKTNGARRFLYVALVLEAFSIISLLRGSDDAVTPVDFIGNALITINFPGILISTVLGIEIESTGFAWSYPPAMIVIAVLTNLIIIGLASHFIDSRLRANQEADRSKIQS